MEFDRPLVFDACSLINLHASGRLGAIVRSVHQPKLVTETVLYIEMLSMTSLDALNPAGDLIEDLIRRGELNVIDFDNDEELGLFIDYAALIGDDGEAASLAVATQRGFSVVTDDRKARSFARKAASHVPLIHTLEILEHWEASAEVGRPEMGAVLSRISENASYQPGHKHPLFEWWKDRLQ